MADATMISRCKIASKQIRLSILEMTYLTGKTGAHIGGSLSLVELLAGLYAGCLRFRIGDSNWEERDRVILSKGHAALALYSSLAEAGVINKKLLLTFKQDGSELGGHPSLNGLPGIEFASGSLGQGLSLGVGVSIGLRRKGLCNPRVFVLLGDGECDEGSIWEAAASASHYGLNNLYAIVDVNTLQYDGYTKEILNMDPFAKKWCDFGWDVVNIDGHNMEEILNAYSKHSDKPIAILAHTIKGKGVSFMEGNWKYHNAVLTKEQYEQAIKEVENNL